MPASAIEEIMSAVHVALLGATAAGSRVYRARDDALSQAEMPAIVVRRLSTDHEAQDVPLDRVRVIWAIECYVRGSDVERQADALHVDVHKKLLSDQVLATKGRALRCLGTEIDSESYDAQVAKLTARYQMEALLRHEDLGALVR